METSWSTRRYARRGAGHLRGLSGRGPRDSGGRLGLPSRSEEGRRRDCIHPRARTAGPLCCVHAARPVRRGDVWVDILNRRADAPDERRLREDVRVRHGQGHCLRHPPASGAQLLAFRDPGHADFGLVVPGGTVEEGETPEQAVSRELREASGLDAVRAWHYLGSMGYVGAGGTPIVRHYFHGVLEGAGPESWTHMVRRDDEDHGWICH